LALITKLVGILHTYRVEDTLRFLVQHAGTLGPIGT